ncbi:hypothetical protein SLEP1_g53694 [Rubroshorea leprosula]|uniref:Uncharacterized protein n=1 Tax=Rubroshorea leprosula TaxID=152421 RepID=A0AAV5MA24_9ROSI|nr:hypothetical protein SLEP1_g53694 [Rubroshorea leprosula]
MNVLIKFFIRAFNIFISMLKWAGNKPPKKDLLL